MDTLTVVASTIIALIVAIGGIITSRATASGAITEAAMKLVTPLKNRIDEQDKDIKKLKKIVSTLEKGVMILTDQLREEHITPKWELNHDLLEEK